MSRNLDIKLMINADAKGGPEIAALHKQLKTLETLLATLDSNAAGGVSGLSRAASISVAAFKRVEAQVNVCIKKFRELSDLSKTVKVPKVPAGVGVGQAGATPTARDIADIARKVNDLKKLSTLVVSLERSLERAGAKSDSGIRYFERAIQKMQQLNRGMADLSMLAQTYLMNIGPNAQAAAQQLSPLIARIREIQSLTGAKKAFSLGLGGTNSDTAALNSMAQRLARLSTQMNQARIRARELQTALNGLSRVNGGNLRNTMKALSNVGLYMNNITAVSPAVSASLRQNVFPAFSQLGVILGKVNTQLIAVRNNLMAISKGGTGLSRLVQSAHSAVGRANTASQKTATALSGGIPANVAKATVTGATRMQTAIAALGFETDGLNATFSKVKRTILGATVAFATYRSIMLFKDALQGSVVIGAEFEQTMARVYAVTLKAGTSAQQAQQQYNDLTEAARRMGATTEYTSRDAAEALKFLGMAGYSAYDAIKLLPGVLNLAAAGQIEIARAADLATNVLTGMRIPVGQLNRVNDVLVRTFTNANVSMEQLAESFKYAAPRAAAYGYSIEEVSSLIGLLGNAGIQGSMAGTQLNFAFERIPKLFAYVGQSAYDAAGNMRTLTDAIQTIVDQDLDPQMIDKIFQVRGGRAVNALVGMQKAFPNYIQQFEAMIAKAGTSAEEIATIQRDTVKVAYDLFTSMLEDIAIGAFWNNKNGLKAQINEATAALENAKVPMERLAMMLVDLVTIFIKATTALINFVVWLDKTNIGLTALFAGGAYMGLSVLKTMATRLLAAAKAFAGFGAVATTSAAGQAKQATAGASAAAATTAAVKASTSLGAAQKALALVLNQVTVALNSQLLLLRQLSQAMLQASTSGRALMAGYGINSSQITNVQKHTAAVKANNAAKTAATAINTKLASTQKALNAATNIGMVQYTAGARRLVGASQGISKAMGTSQRQGMMTAQQMNAWGGAVASVAPKVNVLKTAMGGLFALLGGWPGLIIGAGVAIAGYVGHLTAVKRAAEEARQALAGMLDEAVKKSAGLMTAQRELDKVMQMPLGNERDKAILTVIDDLTLQFPELKEEIDAAGTSVEKLSEVFQKLYEINRENDLKTAEDNFEALGKKFDEFAERADRARKAEENLAMAAEMAASGSGNALGATWIIPDITLLSESSMEENKREMDKYYKELDHYMYNRVRSIAEQTYNNRLTEVDALNQLEVLALALEAKGMQDAAKKVEEAAAGYRATIMARVAETARNSVAELEDSIAESLDNLNEKTAQMVIEKMTEMGDAFSGIDLMNMAPAIDKMEENFSKVDAAYDRTAALITQRLKDTEVLISDARTQLDNFDKMERSVGSDEMSQAGIEETKSRLAALLEEQKKYRQLEMANNKAHNDAMRLALINANADILIEEEKALSDQADNAQFWWDRKKEIVTESIRASRKEIDAEKLRQADDLDSQAAALEATANNMAALFNLAASIGEAVGGITKVVGDSMTLAAQQFGAKVQELRDAASKIRADVDDAVNKDANAIMSSKAYGSNRPRASASRGGGGEKSNPRRDAQAAQKEAQERLRMLEWENAEGTRNLQEELRKRGISMDAYYAERLSKERALNEATVIAARENVARLEAINSASGGRDDSAVAELVKARNDLKIAEAEFARGGFDSLKLVASEVRAEFDRINAALSQEKSLIEAQMASGRISEIEANSKIKAAYMEEQAYLTGILSLYQSIVAEADKLGYDTTELNLNLSQMQGQLETNLQVLSKIALEINASVQSAFESFLDNVFDGTMKLSEAFNQLFRDILKGIAQIMARQIANSIAGSFGGIGGFLSGLFGFAGGGQISTHGGRVKGKGTATSDSIVARLSNGEFVVKAAAVKKYGPNLLHAINAMRLPKIPKYAQGGMVGSDVKGIAREIGDRGITSQSDNRSDPINIYNILDAGTVENILGTHAGEKVILNFLSKRKTSVRRAIE